MLPTNQPTIPPPFLPYRPPRTCIPSITSSFSFIFLFFFLFSFCLVISTEAGSGRGVREDEESGEKKGRKEKWAAARVFESNRRFFNDRHSNLSHPPVRPLLRHTQIKSKPPLPFLGPTHISPQALSSATKTAWLRQHSSRDPIDKRKFPLFSFSKVIV
ncbi:hypothetical protein IE53DRAFT_71941 [Violaceomyces palustris]|uniref:Uncharacterized protein n=1 Tax=Violaceomyces palustris TaxID=1673888 RepID=A0ACD0NYR4_9BASI|nr:hypothetical protein IE53DRAFT_71941 [Violaceomyces palustris]